MTWKTDLWAWLSPIVGYLLVNIGNALMKKKPKASKTREAMSRVSFTTSRNHPIVRLKMPGAKEAK